MTDTERTGARMVIVIEVDTLTTDLIEAMIRSLISHSEIQKKSSGSSLVDLVSTASLEVRIPSLLISPNIVRSQNVHGSNVLILLLP